MTRKMTVTEVKAKLLSLLDQVEEGDEIEITRHGVTVARLAPARGPHALRGRLTGVAMTAGKEDDLYSTDARWDLA
ncbi:MAG TPA: type II toxin-antitoxin system prevent-host-death family antitoxin [Dehalococcoidia bacterium]|nr:type II toxin-antitoxin system prevent-host-death family antitoxin [Dehalococcoidia bacterium]